LAQAILGSELVPICQRVNPPTEGGVFSSGFLERPEADAMGNAMKWKAPGHNKSKEGTTLVELHIGHMRDAHDIIGVQSQLIQGVSPAVLVPKYAVSRACCCPMCWVSIPSGFSAIVTRWGRDVEGSEEDGTWEPGCHWFFPCNRIARLVSRQYMIFDTPVRDCKTKDNITVNIDVLIVFKIAEARTFAYGIGPEKLDDLLRASQEEVLRQMAGDIEVKDIYDLFGTEKTKDYVLKMNESFKEHGVEILSFTVRDVRIPDPMAKDFEDRTLYESKTIEAEMKQQSDTLNLNNEEELSKQKEVCDNNRMAAEAVHVTRKAEITKDVREVTAQMEKKIAMAGGEREAQLADIETNNALEVSKVVAEQQLMEADMKLDIQAKTGKLEAEAEANERRKESEGHLETAKKVSQGKQAYAAAERAAASAFAARRAQEQELKKLFILEKLSENDQITVVTSLENNTGLAPGNSLVSQITQQGMEAFRMTLAGITSEGATKLGMGKQMAGGLVRPMPQQTMAGGSPTRR